MMTDSLVEVEEKFGSLETSLIERLSSCQKSIINVLTATRLSTNDIDVDEHIKAKEGAIELLYSIIDKKNGIIDNLTKKNIELAIDISKKTETILNINHEIGRSSPHSSVSIQDVQSMEVNAGDDIEKCFKITSADTILSLNDKSRKEETQRVSYTNPWCPTCKQAMSLKDRYVECTTCRSVVHPEFSNLPACCQSSLKISKRAFVCNVCFFTSSDTSVQYMSHISSNRDDRMLRDDAKNRRNSKQFTSTLKNEPELEIIQLPSIDLSDGLVKIDFTKITYYLTIIDLKTDCSISNLETFLKRLQNFIEQLSKCQKDIIKILMMKSQECINDTVTNKLESAPKENAIQLSHSIIDKKNEIIFKLRKMNVELLSEVSRKVEELFEINIEMEQEKHPLQFTLSHVDDPIQKSRGEQIISIVHNAVSDIAMDFYKSSESSCESGVAAPHEHINEDEATYLPIKEPTGVHGRNTATYIPPFPPLTPFTENKSLNTHLPISSNEKISTTWVASSLNKLPMIFGANYSDEQAHQPNECENENENISNNIDNDGAIKNDVDEHNGKNVEEKIEEKAVIVVAEDDERKKNDECVVNRTASIAYSLSSLSSCKLQLQGSSTNNAHVCTESTPRQEKGVCTKNEEVLSTTVSLSPLATPILHDNTAHKKDDNLLVSRTMSLSSSSSSLLLAQKSLDNQGDGDNVNTLKTSLSLPKLFDNGVSRKDDSVRVSSALPISLSPSKTTQHNDNDDDDDDDDTVVDDDDVVASETTFSACDENTDNDNETNDNIPGDGEEKDEVDTCTARCTNVLNEICKTNEDEVNNVTKDKAGEKDIEPCQVCMKSASIRGVALKCKNCNSLIHYKCTSLPEYCVLSLKKSRLFICEKCIETYQQSSTKNSLTTSAAVFNIQDMLSCISHKMQQSISHLENKFNGLENSVDTLAQSQNETVKFLSRNYNHLEREDKVNFDNIVLNTSDWPVESLSRTIGNKNDIQVIGEIAKKNMTLGLSKEDDLSIKEIVEEDEEGSSACAHDKTIKTLETLIRSTREQNDILTVLNKEKDLKLHHLQSELQLTKDKLVTTEANVVKSVEVLQQLVLTICCSDTERGEDVETEL